ncbi:hypothetical protein CANINC_001362 [Pichia inconspicua]|uniref:Prefoldin subunit 2 n=1 Tax=Pichia inconspicua TaxID=52247 RepID=A0A4T0X3V6_9ASCO|nr:hypothetical protein CANINC_001362 [[Candida] inconspicua]
MNLQQTYDEYQQTIQQLQEHVVSVESQIYEHEIVIDTLKGVPQDRKAWRLVSNGDNVLTKEEEKSISGGLVETTAAGAREKLEKTFESLNTLKNKLQDEVNQTRQEFEEWKKKNNIKIVQANQ